MRGVNAVLLLLVFWALSSCGDDTLVVVSEPCEPTQAECVTDRIGRSCPETQDPGWIYFNCDSSEHCKEGLCIGSCTAGEKECVSDDLARICAREGTAWVPLACETGTVCRNGECVPSSDGGGRDVCNAGARACATQSATKTCEIDGTGWVVRLCDEGQECVAGRCVADVENGECTPYLGQCLDAATGIRCLSSGRGYEPFDCPEQAPCVDGKCRGSVCSPGDSRCPRPVYEPGVQPFARDQVLVCNAAGDGWTVSQCAAGELCTYRSLTALEARTLNERFAAWLDEGGQDGADPEPTFEHPNRPIQAACELPGCERGTRVCGDPTDADAEPLGSASECTGLMPFAQPYWINYACESPNLCDPTRLGDLLERACSTECVPGETVCDTSFGGIEDATRECGEDGTWLAPVSCNPGFDQRLVCHTWSTELGQLRSAQCAQKICHIAWELQERPEYIDEQVGVCEGKEAIRTCLGTGRLAKSEQAEACTQGSCIPFGLAEYEADGVQLGRCEAVCQPGDRICYPVDTTGQFVGSTGSALYLQCDPTFGRWRNELSACADGAGCYQLPLPVDRSGSQVLCGGECVPGTRRCAPVAEGAQSTAISRCDEQGHWSEPVDCEAGTYCIDEQSDMAQSRDAACGVECVTGSVACEVDSDAGTLGWAERRCGADGRWKTRTPCPDERPYCFEPVGCSECVGEASAALPASVEPFPGLGDTDLWDGVIDTRCESGELSRCDVTNSWAEPGACQSGTCTEGASREDLATSKVFARAACLP